jgi:aspartokinase-like uncharacterized kinase
MSEESIKQLIRAEAEKMAREMTGVESTGRAVLVLDRGWIFAGDVTETDGHVRLTRAVHVRNWSSIGFDGMIANPDSDNVTLKRLDHCVDFPVEAELFRVPVGDSWGL